MRTQCKPSTYQKQTILPKKRAADKEKNASQDEYQPEFSQIKNMNLPIDKSKVSSGSWTLQENRKYVKFMTNHKSDFGSKLRRRKIKIFYKLSKVLKRRNPDQCRSHHQKLEEKCSQDIEAIIKFVQAKILQEEKTFQKDTLDENSLKTGKETLLATTTYVGLPLQILKIRVDFAELICW